MTPPDETHFMRLALEQATLALEADEVPVGAVVVHRGRVIARGHNLTQRLTDVTAHAEMIALTAAANTLGSKYLTECTLFVTLEPCPMCAGALAWAQIGKIYFGASDAKRGYARWREPSLLHPKTVAEGGLLAADCEKLLIDFFKKKRS